MNAQFYILHYIRQLNRWDKPVFLMQTNMKDSDVSSIRLKKTNNL